MKKSLLTAAMMLTMAISTQQALAQEASVTTGGETTEYSTLQDAMTAAVNSPAATITLLANVTLPNDENLTFATGDVTLDLNGKTITGYVAELIAINGGKLAITDGSDDKNGTVNNYNSTALKVKAGSLSVNAGTFKGMGMGISSEKGSDVALSGGRYTSSSGPAVSIYGKSALVPGYSYYNTSTGAELNDNYTGGVMSGYTYAHDVTVKKTAPKVTVTVGGETTDCYSFSSALELALDATAPATITLLADVALGYQDGFSFDRGVITLDLNGYGISNYSNYAIKVNGGTLTIVDSSDFQSGSVSNYAEYVVYAASGSLTIHGGSFYGNYGLYVGPDASCTIDNGFFTGFGGGYAVYSEGKSALAPGYAYFDYQSDEQLQDSFAHPIYMSDGSNALEVYVKESTSTGISDISVNASKAVKTIENGLLIITRDGKRYNAAGQLVK